jgi:glycine/D-amino acid oxidase-like deaminating enzyme
MSATPAKQAGILVVGGGIMGAAIAKAAAHLCDPIEAPLVLLEKSELAAGSTGRSGAILRCFYSDEALVRLAHDSLREWSMFESLVGRSIGFERQGVLTIGGPRAPGTRELVERNAALLAACGVEVELLGGADARRRFGMQVDDEAVCCHEPAGAGVDPLRACEGFAAVAREAGAVTRLGTRVLELVLEGDRVVLVRTDSGDWRADQVVVAAGPWAGPLLAGVGLNAGLRVVRPEQYAVAQPARPAPEAIEALSTIADAGMERWSSARVVAMRAAHPVLLDLEGGAYARCEGHAGRTRVGAMDHLRDEDVADPDRVDQSVGDGFRRWARDRLVDRVPEYERQDERESFVGLYTLSPDGQPLLGRAPGLSNLFVAVGFSGHGFKLAPGVGVGMAQLLAGETCTAFDARFFDPARFARGAAKAGSFGL